MRVPAPQQLGTRYTFCLALVAVGCTLGGCISSPGRLQYERHLSTIVEPATPEQRTALARTFPVMADESTQVAARSDRTPGASE